MMLYKGAKVEEMSLIGRPRGSQYMNPCSTESGVVYRSNNDSHFHVRVYVVCSVIMLTDYSVLLEWNQ
jgi:hypothetical protein